MEYRTFGPPGTGKTTYLSRQIERAVQKHGRDNIIVASFTRAAATELVSRKIDVPPDSVGTLHSLCYRAMGRPEIAELHLQDFNERFPHFALSESVKVNADDMAIEGLMETDGDTMFNQYRRHRVQLLPLTSIHKNLHPFIKAWEGWKMSNDLIDFVDMIGMTLQAGSGPPGGQSIGIYDEVQDFNRLELTLVRKWAEKQEYVILAGDDDQCLYSFTGATPRAFLDPPIPDEQKRILKQSYRIPRAIHKHATKWIKQVKEREPKEYNPRDYEGEVCTIQAHYKLPQLAINAAQHFIKQGKSVMFLTTCGYMLNPIRYYLREEGIPFHNPYRKNRGDWNPLGETTRNRTAFKDRILAFLSRGPKDLWTFEDLLMWAEIVAAKGNFIKGGKKMLEEQLEFRSVYTPDELEALHRKVFESEFLDEAIKRDLWWLRKRAIAARGEKMEYPIRIIEKYGTQGLRKPPNVIVSTIHGVKGGEADVVFLFPDLSLPAMKGWVENKDEHEAIIRTFYVGMTRARESLIICSPATRMHITLQ